MKIFILYLVLINIAGFGIFGLDKTKARHHRWRIRESVLFLFAILGGGLGCLLGMYFFHHKTRKIYFRIGIPLILIAEIVLGVFIYRTFIVEKDYRLSPRSYVQHELSRLENGNTDASDLTFSYQELFLTDSENDADISQDVKDVFTTFFEPFAYKITKVSEEDNSAIVTVDLTTRDGEETAKAYSSEILSKQIEISATPAGVDLTLEDCYLILGNVLREDTSDAVTRSAEISLVKNGDFWEMDPACDLESLVTDSFASYVADVHLLSPSEIVSIHMDTMKSFDTEQLTRYLGLERLVSDDAEYGKELIKALAVQLNNCLDYTITAETLSEDGTYADVSIDLTSCDSSAMLESYTNLISAYTSTSQALEDGTTGRQTKAQELLLQAITENEATTTTSLTVHLTNDGTTWSLEANEAMSTALLGNFPETLADVSAADTAADAATDTDTGETDADAAAEDATENTAADVTEDAAEDVTEDATEDVTEDVTEDATEDAAADTAAASSTDETDSL